MIEALGGFLQHNLIVLLAAVLVPMKLVVLRLCGDDEAQRAAFLAIPEDLVYVSLGLVLGDFATAGGAFRRHFAGSAHLPIDLFVTLFIGLTVAIGVHLFAKWTNDAVRGWRAAAQARMRTGSSDPNQGELELRPTDENIRRIQLRYLSTAAVLFLIQLIAVVRWLAWIASVLANN